MNNYIKVDETENYETYAPINRKTGKARTTQRVIKDKKTGEIFSETGEKFTV